MRVFTVSTRRFQRAASQNSGPRDSGKGVRTPFRRSGCGLTHVDLQMCEIGEAGEQALGALCGDGNDMDLVYEDGVLRSRSSRSDGVGSEPRYKFSN